MNHACIVCGLTKPEPFSLHKAPEGTDQHCYRTCPGGESVPVDQVEAERERRLRRFNEMVMKNARAESSFMPQSVWDR